MTNKKKQSRRKNNRNYFGSNVPTDPTDMLDPKGKELVVYNKTMAEAQEKLHSKSSCFRCGAQHYFSKQCSRCKRATYCDHKCQKKHYKRHQDICEQLFAFDEVKRRIPHGTLQHQGRTIEVSYLLNGVQNSMIYDVLGPSSYVLVKIIEFIPFDMFTGTNKVIVMDAANQWAELHMDDLGTDLWWAFGFSKFICSLQPGNFLLLKHGSWDWWYPQLEQNTMLIRDLEQVQVIVMNQ